MQLSQEISKRPKPRESYNLAFRTDRRTYLGNYECIRHLGWGRYQFHDTQNGRDAVLKVLEFQNAQRLYNEFQNSLNTLK